MNDILGVVVNFAFLLTGAIIVWMTFSIADAQHNRKKKDEN